jgi:hypothetical protein
MAHAHTPHHRRHRPRRPGLLRSAWARLWEGFVEPPDASCPRCRGVQVDYYDPFFFCLWRTLSGRRRYRCRGCGFVWRRSRGEQGFLERMGF